MANDLQEISDSYRRYVNNLRRALEGATEEVAEKLVDKMVNLTTLSDHSLEDLRKAGHPYAWRFSPGVPHEDYLVHQQSEADSLWEGIHAEHEGTWQNDQIASEIHSESAHTWYLLLGTQTMRPRDFASAAIFEIESEANALYKKAFASAGGDFHDDSSLVIEVDPIPHDQYVAQLPNRSE